MSKPQRRQTLLHNPPQAPMHAQHPYYPEWRKSQGLDIKHDDKDTRVAELAIETEEQADSLLPVGNRNTIRSTPR